jgi:HEAT repeat protein
MSKPREAALVPRDRVDRALAEGARSDDPARADLWAEAQIALARHDRPAALKPLRRAAASPEGPRRVASLRALGALADRQAEREVLRAMTSDDPAVFAEAACAAVRIDAPGVIDALVERLTTGPHVRAAARALALAGACPLRAPLGLGTVVRARGSRPNASGR